MRSLHLFAGAGGGLLADLILGHEPVCAVEWDPYCCAVLRERAADGWFPGLHVHEGDVRLFDPSAWQGRVDCLHAGFPCQGISVAGKRLGLADERSGLVSEVWRVVRALRPRWLLLENSPRIVRDGLPDVLAALADLGMHAEWDVLGAADVGAPHTRRRWWCLAHADGERRESRRLGWPPEQQRPAAVGGDWWSAGCRLERVADGAPHRVDRVHACGNGQVPLQAAAAWLTLGGPIEPGVLT